MSKLVKELITDQLKRELDGVQELLLVDVIGLTANRTAAVRKQLREKNMKLLVVKNSLARKATEGTTLAPAFEGSQGTLAMVWGGSDIVALAKEVVRIAGEKDYDKFLARGGVMGGTALKAEEIALVSKWPTREEQLSILLGQILAPGALLASQLTSVGGALASQIEQKAEGAEEDAAPAVAADAEAAPAADAAPEADAPPAPEASA
jgi:large subunit ribosomal protein L10